MSEARHTPGPWIFGGITSLRTGLGYYCVATSDGNTIICNVNNGPPGDAHLIVAAPELLEALKGLLADIENLMGESDGVVGLHLNGDVAPWSDLDEGGRFERLSSLSAARAAIAKATGKAVE